MKEKEQSLFNERYLNLEVINDVVVVREQVAPQMPPKVIFCGSKSETAEFLRNL